MTIVYAALAGRFQSDDDTDVDEEGAPTTSAGSVQSPSRLDTVAPDGADVYGTASTGDASARMPLLHKGDKATERP